MSFAFFLPAIIGFFITLITVPPTIWFARKAGLMDDPNKHKHPAILHKKPIPRAGGLPIYLGILAATLLFIPLSEEVVALLVAGGIVVVTGLLDDKYDLSPYLRFFLNIVAAVIVVYFGINIPFITNPLGGILEFTNYSFSFGGIVIRVSEILAVIWIVWVMNMLNWSKGVDGQMPGITAISAVVIGIASLRFIPLTSQDILTSQLSFIVAAVSLGFLIFNFYPAKIFPGYSATILGFMLGILSISSGVKLATAILVMGIPTFDALFTIVRRIGSKRSPFWHDRGHLHHLLLDYGMSQRSIAIFYWSMSLLLGAVALSVSSRGKLFAILLVVVVLAGFIFMLRFATNKQNYD